MGLAVAPGGKMPVVALGGAAIAGNGRLVGAEMAGRERGEGFKSERPAGHCTGKETRGAAPHSHWHRQK